MSFRERLEASWQKPNWLTALLLPLSLVYGLLFIANRALYSVGLKHSYRPKVPVIVVGNITVGGTGKTPLVIYLIESLKEQGLAPAVISRGYGGKSVTYPLLVTSDTPVDQCGDEPALIVARTGVPLVVGPNRKASIELLCSQHDIDVIISDDGLQHHALHRDVEICLMDKTRPKSYAFLLPSGPYREPLSRLAKVDFVVHHIKPNMRRSDSVFSMWLEAKKPVALKEGLHSKFDFDRSTCALAGIGNPDRFFSTCEEMGLNISKHPFSDHHEFSKEDIDFENSQVLMTEKDAVKCRKFADHRHWFLPVDAKLSPDLAEQIVTLLTQRSKLKND